MAEDQVITEAVATDDEIGRFTSGVIATVPFTLDAGAYSYNERTPVEMTSTTYTVTDSADQEATRKNQYTNTPMANYILPESTDFPRPGS